MKKNLALILALLLALAGCQNVPAIAPGEATSSEASASSSEMSASAGENASSSPDGWQFEQSPAASMAQPEKPPAATVGELEMPEPLFTSSEGYALELLTPVQYDAYNELGRGGPRNFLTADFFWIGEGSKFALANANGKILTDFVYEPLESGWYNQAGQLAGIKRDGKSGVINTATGELVIPCEHELAFPLRGGTLVQCRNGDKIELRDLSDKVRFTLAREDDFIGTQDVLVIHQNEMVRLYSMKDFSPIKNFGADEMSVVRYEGRADDVRIAFTVGDKVGLSDGNGKILIQPTYQEIEHYLFESEYEYAIITQDDKKGVIDLRGKLVVKPEWTDIKLGDRTASVAQGGLWGAITDLDSGTLGIEPIYDFLRPFDGPYAAFERNGSYGLLDKEGNELMNTRFDLLSSGAEIGLDKGYVLFDGHEGPGSYGILTTGGDVVLSGNHYFAMDLAMEERKPDKYIAVCTPQDRWGFLDGKGQFVIDARFENASNFLEKRSVAFVQLDGKFCVIDRKGKVVLETAFTDLLGYNPETMVGVFSYTNEKGQTKSAIAKLLLDKQEAASDAP